MGNHDLETLWEALNSIKDHRGRRHNLASCLALVVCGTLAGARGLSACAELAKNMLPRQHKVLCTWKNPRNGKYEPPSHSAIHRILSGVDPEEFEKVFTGWFNANCDKLPQALSLDGKSLRANLDENGEGQHAVSIIAHDGSPFLPRAQSPARGTRANQRET